MKLRPLYFEGGLGDVLIDTFRYNGYMSLSQLDPHGPQQTVILACHNPFAHELFTWHPNADSIDLRFAPQHLATANRRELDDLGRMEYICSCVNVPFEEVTKGLPTFPEEWPPIYPSIQPVPLRATHNVLLSLDASCAWKSVPQAAIDSAIVPTILEHPDIHFFLVSRPYNKYIHCDKEYLGWDYSYLSNIPNLSIISPTVPDTLNLLLRCDLLVTCHSALAQVSTRANIPTIVSFPDNFSDFLPPKFGKDYTETFISPTVKLIPNSIFTHSIFSTHLKNLIFRPF